MSIIPQDEHWEYTLREKVAPICFPVTLTDVKTFARLDSVDEDSIIEMFIEAATKGAEEYLGRALIQQTLELKTDFWPGESSALFYPRYMLAGGAVMKLPRPPLVNVLSIKTLDESDVATAWDLTQCYWNKGEDTEIVVKSGYTPPINTARYEGGYLVEYVAGYSNATYQVLTDKDALRAAIPMPIRLAIMLWSSMMYSMRGKITANDPPPEAKALLSPYKVVRI